MKTVDELSQELVDYYKTNKLCEFNELYDSEEEAYNNFHDLLSKTGKGLVGEMIEELNMLACYNDLTDKELLEQFDRCCGIIKDINFYDRTREKEQEI